jgi:hypothetical protein
MHLAMTTRSKETSSPVGRRWSATGARQSTTETAQPLDVTTGARETVAQTSAQAGCRGVVQNIEFRTKHKDEMESIADKLLPQRGPDWTARRGVVCEDSDDRGRLFQVVFFDSYESAMQNSNLPITQQLNERMTPLMEGTPTFYNLEVIDDRSF